MWTVMAVRWQVKPNRFARPNGASLLLTGGQCAAPRPATIIITFAVRSLSLSMLFLCQCTARAPVLHCPLFVFAGDQSTLKEKERERERETLVSVIGGHLVLHFFRFYLHPHLDSDVHRVAVSAISAAVAFIRSPARGGLSYIPLKASAPTAASVPL